MSTSDVLGLYVPYNFTKCPRDTHIRISEKYSVMLNLFGYGVCYLATQDKVNCFTLMYNDQDKRYQLAWEHPSDCIPRYVKNTIYRLITKLQKGVDISGSK